MKITQFWFTALMAALCLGAVSTAALAEGNNNNPNWRKKHPRRAEVLHRDRNLRKKTENAENSGKITKQQGEKLEKEENAIRNQEQADAAANGGHITKAEQRDLNREENGVARQLKRDERRDRKKAHKAAGGQQGTTPPAEGGAPSAPSAPAPGSGN